MMKLKAWAPRRKRDVPSLATLSRPEPSAEMLWLPRFDQFCLARFIRVHTLTNAEAHCDSSKIGKWIGRSSELRPQKISISIRGRLKQIQDVIMPTAIQ